MNRICINHHCASFKKSTQCLQCSDCSLLTQPAYNDDIGLQQDQGLQEQPTIWQPAQSDWRSIVAPQTTRRAFPLSVATWGSPPLGPPPLITPPLSSKSITPVNQSNHTTELDANEVACTTRGSSQYIFRYYHNPTAEDKAKDKLKRTCMSCYNKTNKKCQLNETSCAFCTSKNIYCRQPIRTLGLFDHTSFDQAIKAHMYAHPLSTISTSDPKPSICLLTLAWSTFTIPYQVDPPKHINSCYLDIQAVDRDSISSPIIPHLDELLDGDTRPKQQPRNSKRTDEGTHRENLQTSCRRLCTLFHILSHPEVNTVKCATDDKEPIPGLVCMVLHQLGHKVTTLWEGAFEHLRLWVNGPRAKTDYSKHKAAVATSLAQLRHSLEMYDSAFTIWSKKGHPMPRLNCSIDTLASYLEFIGKGIDMNMFDTEHRKEMTTMPTMHLSTISTNHPSPLNNEMTFYDVITLAQSCNFPFQERKSHSILNEGPQATSLTASELPAFSQMTTEDWATPFASEGLEDFLNGSPDAIQEQELKRQAEEALSWLIVKRDKAKQQIRDLEEDIDTLQTILGITGPRKHTIFDEVLPTADAADDNVSPGAVTLVEAEPEVVYESAMPEKRSETTLVNDLQPSQDKDTSDMQDIMMNESVMAPPDGRHHRRDKCRKRKHHSTYTTSKKARMLKDAQGCRDVPTNEAHTTTRHHIKPELHQYDIKSKPIGSDDDTKPPKTSRPISWPRLRLFRRSAGVSVRTLTDVFEKISLKQDKS